jgi:hypothetical protein
MSAYKGPGRMNKKIPAISVQARETAARLPQPTPEWRKHRFKESWCLVLTYEQFCQ